MFVYEIFDEKRRAVLPLLSGFKNDFYLAGGTALALQINHRQSIDFDFFTSSAFETMQLFEKIQHIFTGFTIIKIQEETNTLSVVIDGDINLSFMIYRYPLLMDCAVDEYLRVASLADIVCMKFSAITGRAALKDYVDIYYLIQDHFTLSDIFILMEKKFGQVNPVIYLKGLCSFDDVEEEPLMFLADKQVTLPTIKSFLTKKVREYEG